MERKEDVKKEEQCMKEREEEGRRGRIIAIKKDEEECQRHVECVE